MSRLKRFFMIFIQPILALGVIAIIGSILIIAVCFIAAFIRALFGDFSPMSFQRSALVLLCVSLIVWAFRAWGVSKEEK